MIKYVYAFEEGNRDMNDLLGGKGANLAEMINIGLPVPGGFIITTEACIKYYEDNQVISEEILVQIDEKLRELEENSGKIMGDVNNPLLVSVRSGAKSSMPGMMDTVLNIGMNDEVVAGLISKTNNPRFVYDSYRRLIQMYADVVMGYPRSSFEEVLDKYKEKKNVSFDTDLDANDMEEVCNEFKKIYFDLNGNPFPDDPRSQLKQCIKAVFKSWYNDRAYTYRRLNNIPDNLGTAVNVQAMVYGNYGDNSATGVAFTRNPSTGENKLYGEFLINAQGEDIVAGIRTPEDIEQLKVIMPSIYEEFVANCLLLEEHYKDMQDIEFTVEDGKLYMMQTRSGKRTAAASIKIAVDLVNEGMITKEDSLMMVNPNQLDQLLHDNFDKEALKNSKVIGKGLPASPGAATGKVYFHADDVVAAKKEGDEELILVRIETSPEDIDGMNSATGILTMRGGMTSHAAVVARGMGKSCITGCSDLIIDENNHTITLKNGQQIKEGEYISIDGTSGKVYADKIKTRPPSLTDEFAIFMGWADDVKQLGVRANADTPKDAEQAIEFGATGIGLCRTEHMFFESNRIFNVRKMILADSTEQREAALEKLLPIQRKDFEELFTVMKGLPVTIRYLDPPLHEFLPKRDSEINPLAEALGVTPRQLKIRIESLKEFNPMMGHRGCRVAVSYPEIAKMQTQAIIEAAANVKKDNIVVDLEMMIPLIGDIKELVYVKGIIKETAEELINTLDIDLSYKIGTMIELPRACIIADDIAKEVDFFSFGTNDLTQMVYGFSRDDADFLNDYYQKNIFTFDPFIRLDQIGVGEMIKMAIERGKSTNPNLKIGLCGEHGGEASSIEFCHNVGMDYVSCSPFRIPIARLAVAQSKIKEDIN